MEDPSAFLADRGRAVGSATLKRGQVYLVRAGEQVPADGEVIMGAASVDESAITGESAPVVRESGGDRSSITGGTTVLSDWLVARVTAEAGQSFLDKMIAMVESAARKKTPNEQALELLLAVLVPVRSIYRRAARRGKSSGNHLVGGVVRVPGAYHHRRAAVRYRHCRHEPTECSQCAGHQRTCRRGCG